MRKETLLVLVKNCKKAKGKLYPKGEENLKRATELEELGFSKVAKELQGKVSFALKLSQVVESGYIKITEDKIKDYLNNLAKRYDKEHKKKEMGPNGMTADRTFMDELRMMEERIMPPAHNMVEVRIPYGQSAAEEMYIRSQQERHQREMVEAVAMPRYFMGIDPAKEEIPTETFEAHTCDYFSSKPRTIGQFLWTETKVKDYRAIPPKEVLGTFKKHKRRNIFDFFTIAKVNAVVDPLLLGRIEGCKDRFYIAQWGTDIQLDDVI